VYQWKEVAKSTNTIFYNGIPVFTVGDELNIRVNTDLAQNPIASFPRPAEIYAGLPQRPLPFVSTIMARTIEVRQARSPVQIQALHPPVQAPASISQSQEEQQSQQPPGSPESKHDTDQREDVGSSAASSSIGASGGGSGNGKK
jgi:hypothetical protein